jgi:hypothetical protein
LLVALGDPSYAEGIGAAAATAATSMLKLPVLEVANELPPAGDPAEPASHVVVVVAFTGPGSVNAHARDQIERALGEAVPVLPVGCDGADLGQLGEPLSKLNALDWDDPVRVIQALLALLGLTERERKVFLSYKRTDSEPLAFQLRYALQDRGFDVFLDRYAIPPAVDFQERLITDLGDKAFVVLLEGPSTSESPWVMREVSYAIGQHLALLAITGVGVTADQEVTEVPEEHRWRLDDTMVTADGELTPDALAEVLTRLEWEHALRLRRHREQLVDTLSDWLRTTSTNVVAFPGWTVLAEDGPHRGMYLITPRAPTPSDLRTVDLARRDVDPSLPAIVAHNPEHVEPSRLEVIEWIVARGGDLRAEHHAALGTFLTAGGTP